MLDVNSYRVRSPGPLGLVLWEAAGEGRTGLSPGAARISPKILPADYCDRTQGMLFSFYQLDYFTNYL